MKRCWLIAVALLLQTLAVQAEPPSRAGGNSSEPVEISAERLEADNIAKTLVFIGHAVARQGDITIRGDRLTIHYADKEQGGDVERIIAEGNVRIEQGQRLATGDRAEYFRADERMALTGSPQVRDGQNSVRGHEIVLYLKENRSVVKGGDNVRVNAVFQPDGGGTR